MAIGSEPATTDANVLIRLTDATPALPFEPEPHDARANIAMIAPAAHKTRFMATFKTDWIGPMLELKIQRSDLHNITGSSTYVPPGAFALLRIEIKHPAWHAGLVSNCDELFRSN